MSAFFAGRKFPSLVSNGLDVSCLKEWTKNFNNHYKLGEKQNINDVVTFLDEMFYSSARLKTFMKVVAPFLFECVKQNGDKKEDYEAVGAWCKKIVKRYNNFEQMDLIEETKKKYVESEKKQPSLLDFLGKESYSKSLRINKEALWAGIFPNSKKEDIDSFAGEVISFLSYKKNGFQSDTMSFKLENNSNEIVFTATFDNLEASQNDLKRFEDFLKIVIDGLMVETLDGFKNYSEKNILKALDRDLRFQSKLMVEDVFSKYSDGTPNNDDSTTFKI